jgi:hypothetical protein
LANNNKAKPDVEKSSKEVAVEPNRFPEEKAGTKIEVETSSQWPPNWAV